MKPPPVSRNQWNHQDAQLGDMTNGRTIISRHPNGISVFWLSKDLTGDEVQFILAILSKIHILRDNTKKRMDNLLLKDGTSWLWLTLWLLGWKSLLYKWSCIGKYMHFAIGTGKCPSSFSVVVRLPEGSLIIHTNDPLKSSWYPWIPLYICTHTVDGRNPKQPPGMYKNRANIGINYQPQLVSRISSINSMT